MNQKTSTPSTPQASAVTLYARVFKNILFITAFYFFGFVNIVFSQDEDYKKYELLVKSVFDDKKTELSYADKFNILDELIDFEKSKGEEYEYILDADHVYYYDYSHKEKHLIYFEVKEIPIKQLTGNAVFIKRSCPLYLCGMTGRYLDVFYKINGKYKKVYSNNSAGFSVEMNLKSGYPSLLVAGRGERCAQWVWDDDKLKYKFNRIMDSKACKEYSWH